MLSDLSSRKAVLLAIAEHDRLGRAEFLRRYGFGKARGYFLVYEGRRYDSKAIAGVAHGYQFPDQGPLTSDRFSGGETTVQSKLGELGFVVEGVAAGDEATERNRRMNMMDALVRAGGPHAIPPRIVREIGIYGGAQGIWVDARKTGSIAPGGVAVGLLHTGTSYADDLSDDGLIYHYPATNRAGKRDENEITSLKNAEALRVPIFVVLHNATNGALRDVRMGWVIDHDDRLSQALISFVPDVPKEPSSLAPFCLTAKRQEKRLTGERPERSAMFRFRVLKRYGEKCAVCSISNPRLLDAAHIRGVTKEGSDDPRNGLVLCANHHRAFDAAFFGIEPETLDVRVLSPDVTRETIGLQATSIRHLQNQPHADALIWWWTTHSK
jgi:hypothetical protein